MEERFDKPTASARRFHFMTEATSMSLAAKLVHFEDCALEIGVWVCVRGHDISTQLISGAAQHNTKGVCTLSAYLHSTFLTCWDKWFFQMACSSNQFGGAFSSNSVYFQLCKCLPISLASNMLSGMQGWSRLDWSRVICWRWIISMCTHHTFVAQQQLFKDIWGTQLLIFVLRYRIYLRCGVI